MRHIRKVLVANRGEIAIRVFRACSELGIRTVAIYSKEDILSLHRNRADEAYLVGEGDKPIDAYLDIEDIIRICKEHDVDAIHPGYGFLAENAKLAKRCEEEGIIFIGPRVEHLMMFGDKVNSRIQAEKADIPMIPGSKGAVKSFEEVKEFAEKNGFPIMIKAVNGGGGRGMRLCEMPEDVIPAFELVKSEARKAFGNDDIFIEKYLVQPKHIEVQILADQYGNVYHLGERDCSLQRRYQKVVEFAPAWSVPQKTVEALRRDAVKIAKSVGYVSAGTVEFLVDKNGDYYFIEMNPRIQVEHTVTEMVTGVDIVRSQILILKESEYVTAARALGASSGRIIKKHLLTNCMGTLIVTTTLQIPSSIFTESYLSFLGLGVAAPMPSLGSLATDAVKGMNTYPVLLIAPALMISVMILVFNLFGDGLRDAFDPKLKS